MALGERDLCLPRYPACSIMVVYLTVYEKARFKSDTLGKSKIFLKVSINEYKTEMFTTMGP